MLKTNEKERAEKTSLEFDNENNHIFVLEINNEIVGFVNCGRTEDSEFENCGEIFSLYIIKKYKGMGFGKKLVEAAINEIKQLGCNKMIDCILCNLSNDFYTHISEKYIKYLVYKKLNLPENFYYFEI